MKVHRTGGPQLNDIALRGDPLEEYGAIEDLADQRLPPPEISDPRIVWINIDKIPVHHERGEC